ncbi:MAG: DsrE family protein [Deferrisomatales bacterium]|nr:DsrE family protein [Deferrisomatales bacterium]
MKGKAKCLVRVCAGLVWVAAAVCFSPAAAQEYAAALQGLERLDVVFDVAQGNPAAANVVFWAVRDVYQAEEVRALPEKPRVVVAFRGPAVRLLSTKREGVTREDAEAMDRFAATLREMKKDGVRLEVCLYAVQVLGVDPASLLPEVDRVTNGFVSVVGYQNQGYAVVAIP